MNQLNYSRMKGPGDFDAPAELEDDSRPEAVAPFRMDPEARRALRKMKGRPEFRVTYTQWDATARRMLPATVAPDPIYGLAVARKCRRMGPHYAMSYGVLLQRVVSPALLPEVAA